MNTERPRVPCVSQLPPVSFYRYQSVSFVAVPPRSLQLYMYGTGSKTPGESDTLTRDTCSGKKTPGAAGTHTRTRTGNHWLKTRLKTQLFAFHAQKRTHTSTQDEHKIAIRIEGLNILNAASGSARACSVSMGSCKVYNCILSGQ